MERDPDAHGHGAARAAEKLRMERLSEGLGEDFDVLNRLGEGEMASVYLARDRALDLLVAVKVLKPLQASDETSRRRFEREAKAAASLSDHPNVVDVYRFGRLADETPFLVMRFVKGRTMGERLAAEGRLSLDEARGVLLDVASALEEAHAKGIVHRDVRPGNVLWDEERARALLTDFGVAAILATSGQEADRLTRTGQVIGIPRYASPEQLADEELTEMADIYAVGVLGYELLTLEDPYDARTLVALLEARRSGTPRDLQDLRSDVPADLADLLVRCLHRQPKHRPSARDVVRRLRGEPAVAAAGGGGEVAVGAPPDELMRRRVPQIVGLTGAVVMSAVALVDLYKERLPVWAADLTMATGAAALLASFVIAWFHGARGRQRAPGLEWLLLAVIAITWAAVSWLVIG